MPATNLSLGVSRGSNHGFCHSERIDTHAQTAEVPPAQQVVPALLTLGSTHLADGSKSLCLVAQTNLLQPLTSCRSCPGDSRSKDQETLSVSVKQPRTAIFSGPTHDYCISAAYFPWKKQFPQNRKPRPTGIYHKGTPQNCGASRWHAQPSRPS
jgi:hypothetical protein